MEIKVLMGFSHDVLQEDFNNTSDEGGDPCNPLLSERGPLCGDYFQLLCDEQVFIIPRSVEYLSKVDEVVDENN